MKPTQPTTNEKADAQASAGATLVHGAQVLETAKVVGTFHAKLIGPREECREEYIALRDERFAKERALEIAIAAMARGMKKTRELRTPVAMAAAKTVLDSVIAKVQADIDSLKARMEPMEEVKDATDFPNVVTTVGGNYLLDNGLAGSAYTAAFFLGLISSVSYTTGPALGDTMASHAGWTEAGATNAPAYSQGARPTAAWAAAAAKSKSLSAALTFSFTSAGTVKGCFLTTVATKDGTTGTLYSAGTFTGGDKIVANGDSLQVSYTASI